MAPTLKYPLGIQTFSTIIEEGYVYIDKTRYIKELRDSGKYYFLSRPRRFGKSLLLSTMEAYFEGRRDLFKGLEIYDDMSERRPCPVLKFSFNTLDAKTERSLKDFLSDCLVRYEECYGRNTEIKTLSQRFANIIVNAYGKTGEKVVVLIDEYDAPLLNTLELPELNESYRQTL